MTEEQEIVHAVRSIRPYLHRVLDEAELAQLLPTLDQLLADASRGKNVDSLLIDQLRKYKNIRTWLADTLDQEAIRKGYSGLPGSVTPIAAGELYRCPTPGCDFEYRLRRAGQTVPLCIIHQITLIKS